MRAVVVHEHGGLEKLCLEDRPEPRAAADEVVVRVRVAGLNHLDLWVRRGVEGHVFPLPLVLGCDGAGIVEEAGPLAGPVQPGERVVLAPGLSCGRCEACLAGQDNLCRSYGILGETRDGTCADRVCVPGRNVIAIPDDLSFERAATVSLVYLTAWHMLVHRAEVRPGQTVLVHAGASGVGGAAIQIARMLGARVIATAGSAAKLDVARDLGAEHTINYRTEDFASEVRRLTDRAGVEIVLDHVGEATFDKSLRLLKRGGCYVTCGATSGFAMRADFRPVFFKSLSILGSTMGGLHELHTIWRLVGQGRLVPREPTVLALDEIREAHRRLEERQVPGKVALAL